MNKNRKSKPVTGGKAGGDGTKAKSGKRPMIGSKAETASARKRLVGILEEYDVSVTGFDGLRADAYEKHLARQSLTELAAFYARLLNTCEHYQKIQKQCLPWGNGTDDQGKLPSVRTLTVIKERILTERRLAEMAPRLQALAQVARSLTGLPVAERAVVLQGMQALIAAELMELVGNGKRVLDHLPAVDRVIRAVSAQARVEQTAERCRLQEEALEIRKSMFEIRREEWELRKNAECRVRNAESRAKAAKVDEYAGLTEDEKSDRLLERAFGKNPYAEEEKAVKEAQTDVASVAPGPTIQKSNDECKMTNGEGTTTVKAVNDTKTSVTLAPNHKETTEPQTTEPVETIEEYQQRQREAEEHRRWVKRQMRIRDKVNGTEVSFNPYA